MKNKKREKLIKIYLFIRFRLPVEITSISLYGLAWILLYKGKTELIFTSLLIVIAITIAMSQTCFTYLTSIKDKKTKEVVKIVGEHFLAASMWMSIAALITFLSFQYDALVEGLAFSFKIPGYLLYTLALVNFYQSAESINKGIHRIGYILFWKVDM